MVPAQDEEKRVVLGRVNGLYGVQGWLKIFSYSRPRENIFAYDCWLLESSAGLWLPQKVQHWKKQGKGLIAQFDGIIDRNAALAFLNRDIAVARSALPELGKDEYYWCDLIGLKVVNLAEKNLGMIVEIKETGANDVLVVKGDDRYLIPLLSGSVVKSVDQERGMMRVDWDGEYI